MDSIPADQPRQRAATRTNRLVPLVGLGVVALAAASWFRLGVRAPALRAATAARLAPRA